MRLPAHLLRTKVAQTASEFATTFNLAFGKTLLPPGAYRPEMMVPGQSTAGGKQAMQHMRLVPQESGYSNLVIGDATATERIVELRTFEAIDEAHRAHWGGQPVQLDRANYATFLLKLQGFFEAQGFLVTLLEPSTSVTPPGNKARSGLVTGFLLGMIVIVVAAGGFLLLRR